MRTEVYIFKRLEEGRGITAGDEIKNEGMRRRNKLKGQGKKKRNLQHKCYKTL